MPEMHATTKHIYLTYKKSTDSCMFANAITYLLDSWYEHQDSLLNMFLSTEPVSQTCGKEM